VPLEQIFRAQPLSKQKMKGLSLNDGSGRGTGSCSSGCVVRRWGICRRSSARESAVSENIDPQKNPTQWAVPLNKFRQKNELGNPINSQAYDGIGVTLFSSNIMEIVD